jgi:hypothetical protein
VSESYKVREALVSYGATQLAEFDLYGKEYRALPPAEDMVLIAQFENESQVELAADQDGLLYVSLGGRRGPPYVHPNLGKVRHALLRTRGGVTNPGLLRLLDGGFLILDRSQLRIALERHSGAGGVEAWKARAGKDGAGHTYALFRTTQDASIAGQHWNHSVLRTLIARFESDKRNRIFESLPESSPYPRVLPLRDVLRSRA